MLKIDKQTLDELPNYTYLGCSDVGIWALVLNRGVVILSLLRQVTTVVPEGWKRQGVE